MESAQNLRNTGHGGQLSLKAARSSGPTSELSKFSDGQMKSAITTLFCDEGGIFPAAIAVRVIPRTRKAMTAYGVLHLA